MEEVKTPEQMAEEYAEFGTQGVPDSIRKQQLMAKDRMAFLAGYQAAELKAKMEFAAKYDHNSPLQVIAAEYVKRRGTIGPLALLEENRFIDGYEAGMNSPKKLDSWVSVKDRLPEITHIVRDNGDGYSDDVLMLFTDGTMEVIEFELRDGVVETGHGNSLNIVTHWMPLPEAPKDK